MTVMRPDNFPKPGTKSRLTDFLIRMMVKIMERIGSTCVYILVSMIDLLSQRNTQSDCKNPGKANQINQDSIEVFPGRKMALVLCEYQSQQGDKGYNDK